MDLSNTAIAIIVVLVVAGFLLGNFMAARPSPAAVRVADFRLMARSYQIFPKLIACPDWLVAQKNLISPVPADRHLSEATAKIAQYTLTAHELALPMVQYQAVAGVWRLVEQDFYTAKMRQQAARLDGVPILLPDAIASRTLGLSMKANAVALYWFDDKYQHSHKAYKLDKNQAAADLADMYKALIGWAETVAAVKPSMGVVNQQPAEGDNIG